MLFSASGDVVTIKRTEKFSHGQFVHDHVLRSLLYLSGADCFSLQTSLLIEQLSAAYICGDSLYSDFYVQDLS